MEVQLPEEGVNLPHFLENLKNTYITVAMKKAGGNVTKAAELLGMKRTTLRMHMLQREMPSGLPVSPVIDPEGEFTVTKVVNGYQVRWKGELMCKKRNIKEVNKFLREKING